MDVQYEIFSVSATLAWYLFLKHTEIFLLELLGVFFKTNLAKYGFVNTHTRTVF